MIPYFIVVLINFTDPVSRTLLEFASLFLCILAFFLLGFETLRAFGLQRPGEAVLLPIKVA